MTDNKIGYLVYRWEQEGYKFIPLPYDKNKDYTKYLNYFSDPEANAALIRMVTCRGEMAHGQEEDENDMPQVQQTTQ